MICSVCKVEFVPRRINQARCSRTCCNIYFNRIQRDHKIKWYQNNQNTMDSARKNWLQKYPERRKESSRKFQSNHKEYYTAYHAKRRFAEKTATPFWADENEITDIYTEAQYFRLEVDHIIPLKHSLVCGLHVPANLQLLSRSENAKKGNKFVPHDEDVQVRIK